MGSNYQTFTIWVDLEDWIRSNFVVEPAVLNEEKVFNILTETEIIGVLHKTFEDTWECLTGSFTLQDSERLGDEIDRFYGGLDK